MSQLNPDQLLDEIEISRARLASQGEAYCNARWTLVKAQLAYEKAMGREFLKMLADAEKKGGRVPAEDMRKAIAHSKIGDKIWENYLLAVADVDSADRLIKVEQANLSGLQSELGQLKVEYTHA